MSRMAQCRLRVDGIVQAPCGWRSAGSVWMAQRRLRVDGAVQAACGWRSAGCVWMAQGRLRVDGAAGRWAHGGGHSRGQAHEQERSDGDELRGCLPLAVPRHCDHLKGDEGGIGNKQTSKQGLRVQGLGFQQTGKAANKETTK